MLIKKAGIQFPLFCDNFVFALSKHRPAASA